MITFSYFNKTLRRLSFLVAVVILKVRKAFSKQRLQVGDDMFISKLFGLNQKLERNYRLAKKRQSSTRDRPLHCCLEVEEN